MKKKTTRKADWQAVARRAAQIAFEEDFKSRRGSYPLGIDEMNTKLVIYNNHPYSASSIQR